MQDFDIIFYDKPDGTEPVKEFLDSLDVKMRAKMIRTIVILQKNGYELREPYSKMLNEGILELRAKVGSDISRVLYFFISEVAQVFIRNRTLDFTNAEDVFLRSIKNLQ